MTKDFHVISLLGCAAELGLTPRYVRRLFHRTGFAPLMRIHQRAFYQRFDFEAWCADWQPQELDTSGVH